MANLKVRLDDGSEVGPMDLDMVHTWFQQGLISAATLVQKPGSARWMPLANAADISRWRSSASAAGRGRTVMRGSAGEVLAEGSSEQRWRPMVAAVLLFLLAAAVGVAAFRPELVRPELDGAPWARIGLGLAVLGLLLVRGWGLGRRVARVAFLLAAASAFPLAGLFVARGMRHEALLSLGCGVLLAAGLVAFLAPNLSRLAAAASLLLVLSSAAGAVRFAWTDASAAVDVGSWAAAERRIADAGIGLDVALPEGWVALKPGNPLLAAPPATRLTFAQPRVSGFAVLLSEPAPPGVLKLEHYLDHVIAQRRAAAADYQEEWRRDGRLGALASRRASTRRGGSQDAVVERIAVAQDADRFHALVTWVPVAAGGRALEEADAIEAAVSLSGVVSQGRQQALQQANLELPHLSQRTILRLIEARGPAAPGELFRRASAACSGGAASLEPTSARELQELTAGALSALAPAQRDELALYQRRVAAGLATQPEEDERMRLLMKTAIVQLAAAQRTRLEELHDRAILASLEASAAP